MRTLEIVEEHDGITQQAQDEYAKLFQHPLSESHIRALAVLFKWHIPDEFTQGEVDVYV